MVGGIGRSNHFSESMDGLKNLVKANNKANNGIRRDAATAAAAKYERLYSNFDNSSSALVKALAVAKTNLTVKLAAIQANNPGHDVTASIFVASEGHGHLVLHEEESHHLFLKSKVLLSNWKIMKEQLTGVTSITMSVSLYATTSKIIANHVEWQVQLHVRDVLPDNVMLMQVKPGSGGCRFIVHDFHGNLP